MSKNKYLLVPFVIFSLLVSLFFAAYYYSKSNQKYAGQLVYKTCNGSYIKADSLGKGVNPGGPCITSSAFVLNPNNTPFYISLTVLSAVVILDVFLIYKSRSTSASKL